jgi:hypothetical protein
MYVVKFRPNFCYFFKTLQKWIINAAVLCLALCYRNRGKSELCFCDLSWTIRVWDMFGNVIARIQLEDILNASLFSISLSHMIKGNSVDLYRVIQKEVYTLKNLFYKKLLKLNPCPVYGRKGDLSKFWYRWSEAAHHWGCGCCYLWHDATSVGRAGLSI